MTASNLTLFGSGGVSLLGSTASTPCQHQSPAPPRISPYTYSATGAGLIGFSGTATGFSAALTITAAQNGSNGNLLLQTPAQLSAAWTTSQFTQSIGQTQTVVLVVQNVGQATALAVSPVAGTPAVSPTAGVFSSTGLPAALGASLAGGASVSFTYTYAASLTGTAFFSDYVSAGDGNSLLGITSSAALSNTLTVQQPTSLTASIIVSPASTQIGGIFTVSMTIVNGINSATSSFISVPASLAVNPASATLLSSPAATSTGALAGGSNVTFIWTYSASGIAAPISFAAQASGQDINSSLAVLSNYVTGTAQIVPNYPLLSASWLAPQPLTATTGQIVTAILQVTDVNLQVGATAITATSFGVTTSPALGSFVDGPKPLTATSIAPGGSAFFTYRYTFSPTGSVAFTATAFASPSGGAGAFAQSLSVTVQNPPNLSVSSALLSPADLGVGQAFTLVVSVSNTGAATATHVAPAGFVKLGSASPDPLSAAQPVSATLAAGQSQAFTYTSDANNVGPGSPWNLSYVMSAAGLDANSGGAVGSLTSSSNSILIHARSVLFSSLSVSASTMNLGAVLTVVMTVSNSSDAVALTTTPSLLVSTGSGGLQLLQPGQPAFGQRLQDGPGHLHLDLFGRGHGDPDPGRERIGL